MIIVLQRIARFIVRVRCLPECRKVADVPLTAPNIAIASVPHPSSLVWTRGCSTASRLLTTSSSLFNCRRPSTYVGGAIAMRLLRSHAIPCINRRCLQYVSILSGDSWGVSAVILVVLQHELSLMHDRLQAARDEPAGTPKPPRPTPPHAPGATTIPVSVSPRRRRCLRLSLSLVAAASALRRLTSSTCTCSIYSRGLCALGYYQKVIAARLVGSITCNARQICRFLKRQGFRVVNTARHWTSSCRSSCRDESSYFRVQCVYA